MSNRGITSASAYPVVNPASRQSLISSNAPLGVNLSEIRNTIPILNRFETKCLLIQLAQLESNNVTNLVSVGNPTIGNFKGNINDDTVVSWWNTTYANVATVLITNSDHSTIKLGMVANTTGTSTGKFGSNTMVIAKSVSGNITAGNFIPGFTYTVTSIGTTDFTLCGVGGGVTNVVIGNVFVANSAGTGTGTAFIANNQIMLGSDHLISGDITFTVSPLKLGKYQNSQWLLTKLGYINEDGSWNAKDGVDSIEVFALAAGVQDLIMRDFIQTQYSDLIKSGAIRPNDSKEVISGMLALAYQYQDLGNPQLNESKFNTDGTINLSNFSIGTRANVWRNTGQVADSQGRPGHIHFNAGRYAIRTLGADLT